MKVLLKELPMPPSENEMYPSDWKTGRRFTGKELIEYQNRMRAWSLRNERWKKISEIQNALTWIMADHRKVIRIDSYVFLQREKFFTKIKSKNDRPHRKKMDVSNKMKALYDQIGAMLEIDDCRFTVGVVEPVIIAEGMGQWVSVVLEIEMLREQEEVEKEILTSLGDSAQVI